MSPRFIPASLLALSLGLLVAPVQAQDDDEEFDSPAPTIRTYDFGDAFISGELSVTPGGAQDVRFFRDRVDDGEIPHPNVFTAEGLFSEHDLPTATAPPCRELICVHGEAGEGRLLVQPDVRYIAQIGFGSNLTADTFEREPLHLVAVVDKSGSMSGQPLNLVKDSLAEVLGHLNDRDYLSIVLYGDRAHVHLAPTPATRRGEIRTAISAIQSAGSTAMEDGLRVGFDLARRTGQFHGTTRVMLFTDERPNVGRTDAQSFMGMAERASKDGVGMTTIGVGVQFGAELATKISSVRGGNLFYFPDAPTMVSVFKEDFDTMVTEMAYDMELVVRPMPGMKLAGLYGIPGDMLEWTDDGGIKVGIATLFLSKRKGAVFASFAPDTREGLPKAAIAPGRNVGMVDIGYLRKDGVRKSHRVGLPRIDNRRAGPGMVRGWVLINEATTLKEATRLHHEENNQEDAYQLVHALAGIFRSVKDPELAPERALVFKLEETLAKLSGHSGEPSGPPKVNPISGLPQR